MVRTGATFADAAAEWLRYVEHDRMRKASTVATYRSLLGSRILPAFGELPIESITVEMIESWIASVDRMPATRVKLLTIVHGIFKRARKVWGLNVNPAVDVETPPGSGAAQTKQTTDTSLETPWHAFHLEESVSYLTWRRQRAWLGQGARRRAHPRPR
jgi:hypothetical protein